MDYFGRAFWETLKMFLTITLPMFLFLVVFLFIVEAVVRILAGLG